MTGDEGCSGLFDDKLAVIGGFGTRSAGCTLQCEMCVSFGLMWTKFTRGQLAARGHCMREFKVELMAVGRLYFDLRMLLSGAGLSGFTRCEREACLLPLNVLDMFYFVYRE